MELCGERYVKYVTYVIEQRLKAKEKLQII